MSLYLKMDAYGFVNKYAEIVHRPRLNLRSREGGGCVFLEGNSCVVYPARPKQCADFPGAWRIKELESFCLGQKRANERATGRP
jgi:Fe-S-cluster containining protein